MTPRQWSELHRSEMIQDIAALVACPSVSEAGGANGPYGPGVAKALETAADIAGRCGFAVRPSGHVLRVICKAPDMPDGSEIGIWAHLDVVPPGPGWTRDPWKMEEHRGYLVGRGVKDNKGPAMAALYAMRWLKEEQVPFPQGLSLYLGASEENGMGDLPAYLQEGGSLPDYSIVADGRWPVAFAEKGQLLAEFTARLHDWAPVMRLEAGSADNAVCGQARVWLTERPDVCAENIRLLEDEEGVYVLEARGISRHAAFPEGSLNALGLLTKTLSELTQLPPGLRERLEAVAFVASGCDGSALGLRCGDADSGPLTCAATGGDLSPGGDLRFRANIRYPITCSEAELEERLRSSCRELGFSVRILKSSPPAGICKSHPLVTALTAAYSEIMGRTSPPFVLAGGTYAGRLPQAVSFGMGGWPEPDLERAAGPGKGGAHAPNEAVLISNLLRGSEIYMEALKRLGTTRL